MSLLRILFLIFISYAFLVYFCLDFLGLRLKIMPTPLKPNEFSLNLLETCGNHDISAN